MSESLIYVGYAKWLEILNIEGRISSFRANCITSEQGRLAFPLLLAFTLS